MKPKTSGAPPQLPLEYMQCEVMRNTFSFECAAEDGYLHDIVQQLKWNEEDTTGLQTVYRNQDYWINRQRTDHVNCLHTNIGSCTAVDRRRLNTTGRSRRFLPNL